MKKILSMIFIVLVTSLLVACDIQLNRPNPPKPSNIGEIDAPFERFFDDSKVNH
jgi:outer membrane lipopolysaccharide assembly protein LptE/RlpB